MKEDHASKKYFIQITELGEKEKELIALLNDIWLEEDEKPKTEKKDFVDIFLNGDTFNY